MTDQFITDLDAITSFSDTDLMVVEVNPGGTPETNKITIADWLAEYVKRFNYQISRTVLSNNMTVAIKDASGNDATSAKPLNFNINGTIRKVTGALSVTVNAGAASGAGTFNAGSAELKTLEIDYFTYVGWRASDSSVFVIISRIPNATTYADFSATAANEKYGAYSGSAPASTDEVTVVGRFNATNSGTASYNWSIPATSVVINRPIHETRWLNWTPTYSANGSLTYTSVSTTYARYKVIHNSKVEYAVKASGTLGGTGNTQLRLTVPFESAQSANTPAVGTGNSATVAAFVVLVAGTPDIIAISKYDASNYATSGTAVINILGFYET